MRPSREPRGFTLIEVMVTLAILAIISAVALPSYSAYVQRSKVPAALDALSAYATRMEQRYQDTGNYANGTACGAAWPTPAPVNFTMSCALVGGNQAFTATATGSGPMSGYSYTIDNNGNRNTTAHPKGVPATACWTTRGGSCDS
jgi:type IV pilus assembly protein PilE